MSHTTKIKMEIKDKQALVNAVKFMREKLNLPVNVIETNQVKLFQGRVKVNNGIAVELPDWKYPVLFDLDTGEVYYDNYDGYWGDEKWLNLLKQIYTAQKTIKAVKKQFGLRVASKLEQQLAEQLKDKEPKKIRLRIVL
jgi:hypothetical protein